ncbi:unnamed protein product [Victoria cruziana]
MNDAPESIVADRNFLVSDMNDGPESSTIAHNKKDEHDTVITSSENSIGVDAGNAVDSHIPVEGMQFNSEEDAYTFYNEYALRHGFSVRRSSWDKNAQGIIVRKTFVCSKEGWKNSNKNPTSRKPDTRCGCPARMVLRRLPNGKYFVRTFIRDHNHPLASPSTSHLLRSHRKAISSCPATGELTNNAGIAPKKTCKQLVKVNDDHKNVPFIPTNCRNHLRVKRTKTMKNSEICALFDYLQKKSSNDPGFYSTMQLDEDGYVTNVFWADLRSRVDYECFNDVLVFDTTMKINTDQWPFVQFVGVNHHSQSCIFGGAFLYDESIESFEWLFRVFTEAMNGKHPQVVLTDIDNAIAVAVSHVWPNAHHRLCLWHVFQNAEKNICHVLNQKTGFKESFKRCIFQCEDDDTLRSSWEQMIQVYNLEKNLWLQKLYTDKEKWALAYGRQYFCAGMVSTQRVESMHATLRKCLYSCLTIFHFMEQYEVFINGLRQSEREEDVKGFNTNPITLGMKILMQPGNLYTPIAFEWLKKEVIEALNCSLEVDAQEVNMKRYRVVWEGEEFPKRHEAYVTYNIGNKLVECTCKRYEFKGILCRHALKALDRENVKEIPESYIMQRWTKHAKIKMLNISCQSGSTADDKCYRVSRYQLMCRSLLHIADLASENEEAYEYLSKLTNDALKKVYLLHHESVAAHGTMETSTKK